MHIQPKLASVTNYCLQPKLEFRCVSPCILLDGFVQHTPWSTTHQSFSGRRAVSSVSKMCYEWENYKPWKTHRHWIMFFPKKIPTTTKSQNKRKPKTETNQTNKNNPKNQTKQKTQKKFPQTPEHQTRVIFLEFQTSLAYHCSLAQIHKLMQSITAHYTRCVIWSLD